MGRLNTSFVLGYHGCEKSVAERAIAGEYDLIESDEQYDWLGPGAYFWESDPRRAAEWAREKIDRKSFARGAVVGAVIDLRYSLDLTTRDDIAVLRAAYESFVEHQAKAGLEIPQNKSPKGRSNKDRPLRFLDCAVIKHLHALIADSGVEYDTVRGLFGEGDPIYDGSGFSERTHTQIAVRDPSCVLGLFWPRGDAAKVVESILATTASNVRRSS